MTTIKGHPLNLLQYCKWAQSILNTCPREDWVKKFIELRSKAFVTYHNGLVLSNSHGVSYFDNVIKYWDNPEEYHKYDEKGKEIDYKIHDKDPKNINYEYNFQLLIKRNKI